MSRNHSSTMVKFLKCLDLETKDDNLFVGYSPKFGWQRIFGGQFIAQCLVAAQRTVGENRFVHSLHGYFLRPGNPELPIIFDVNRVRDGASFVVRSVEARQNNELVFIMQASFHRRENGFEHQSDMPDVELPEKPDLSDMVNIESGEMIEPLKTYINKERPFEFRPVSLDHYTKQQPLAPYQLVWLKIVAPITESLHQSYDPAMLAYISDALLVDTALFPHATNIFDGSIRGASLDHSMWFHRPFKLDEWVLYQMDSPSASGARGMTRGQLFSQSGALIASVAQEGLIRKRLPR